MKKINLLFTRSYKVVLVLVIGFMGMATITHDDGKYFDITKNIEIFTNLYKELNTHYVDDIDPSQLMRTGIDAMLGSLDPYTNYISEAEIEDFRFMTTGKYGGIGAIISHRNNKIVIAEPYEGFPAQKAGLKAGDVLLKIDGKSVEGKTTDQISNILKGSPGTKASLVVKRPGVAKDMTISLTREEIKVPNVPYHGMINEEIGYLTLTTFTQKAGANVGDALKKLKEENPKMKGVIFDLRNNGGGLLNEAINVSNVFVPKGEEVVTTRGKIKDMDRNFKTLNRPVDIDIPLVVLINGGSASASEIVSGVIQDFDRGVLIGQRSYGKGLVQNTRDVGYNSRVKLTTAKYYIPSKRCIQAVEYENGAPVEIADSLRAIFKTRSGRKVYDGGGLKPDVKIAKEPIGNITRSLMSKSLIFDYATEYARTHDKIVSAKEFKFSDSDFDAFAAYLKGKDYTYETASEKTLNDLEERAKKEKYFEAIKGDIAQMQKRINTDKANDLYKFKAEIVDLLEREIVSRYYYQKGKIEIGLQNDEEIKEAVKVINDKALYAKLLKPQ